MPRDFSQQHWTPLSGYHRKLLGAIGNEYIERIAEQHIRREHWRCGLRELRYQREWTGGLLAHLTAHGGNVELPHQLVLGVQHVSGIGATGRSIKRVAEQ